MTVLQKIIENLERRVNNCIIPDCQSCKEQNFIIRHLQSNLPAEQQQIRDVWKTACKWKDGYNSSSNNTPDLEQYLTNLKSLNSEKED